MAATDKDITGTRDTVYDLVSIIYHALQGAETYGMYVGDAEEVGDAELAGSLKRSRKRSDDAPTARSSYLLLDWESDVWPSRRAKFSPSRRLRDARYNNQESGVRLLT